MIGVTDDPDIVEAFEASSGGTRKPRLAQVHLCWAATEEEARRTARHWWPNGGLAGPLLSELAVPEQFAAAARDVEEDDVVAGVACGPDPEVHVAAVKRFVAAGFTTVFLHQIGPEQCGFLQFAHRELLPRIRAALMRRSPPIAEHRLLSDGRSHALLRPNAEIDWWCWPRVHSSPVCWSLLDAARRHGALAGRAVRRPPRAAGWFGGPHRAPRRGRPHRGPRRAPGLWRQGRARPPGPDLRRRPRAHPRAAPRAARRRARALERAPGPARPPDALGARWRPRARRRRHGTHDRARRAGPVGGDRRERTRAAAHGGRAARTHRCRRRGRGPVAPPRAGAEAARESSPGRARGAGRVHRPRDRRGHRLVDDVAPRGGRRRPPVRLSLHVAPRQLERGHGGRAARPAGARAALLRVPRDASVPTGSCAHRSPTPTASPSPRSGHRRRGGVVRVATRARRQRRVRAAPVRRRGHGPRRARTSSNATPDASAVAPGRSPGPSPTAWPRRATRSRRASGSCARPAVSCPPTSAGGSGSTARSASPVAGGRGSAGAPGPGRATRPAPACSVPSGPTDRCPRRTTRTTMPTTRRRCSSSSTGSCDRPTPAPSAW